MLAYAGGEVLAFEILLGRHERGVYNFVYRSVHNTDRAEELTQEVFLRVVKNAKRYKRTAKFTTWLYTIARNLCIDESRRRKHRGHVSLDATVGDDEGGQTFKDRVTDHRAESGAARRERARFVEALQQGVDALPDEQREVFVLRHIEGLKFVEIAEIVGVSENTIKSRMRYALASLRLHVADFEGVSFDDEERDDIGDVDAPEAL